MLLALATGISLAGTGPERFLKFMQNAKTLSVHVTAHSRDLAFPGRGTLVISKPNSIRLDMMWSNYDYHLRKSSEGQLEYTEFQHTYQDYLPSAGLDIRPSLYTRMQGDSVPTILLRGDLRAVLPPETQIKLASTANGIETYTAEWTRGGQGKVVAAIDAQGRLTKFDFRLRTMDGEVHRWFEFSNYAPNLALNPSTFALIPPTGLTVFKMPYFLGPYAPGDKLELGTWRSDSGSQNLDTIVGGKLIVVREDDSPPADRLIKFLKDNKLPAELIVLSLGSRGGAYHSPATKTANGLRALGTPLLMFVGKDMKIKGMWLGFDPDEGKNLLQELEKAAKA